MANRRITQFQNIEAGTIVDQDVLTLVHVNEIDPALRNKKITFSEFREYLDIYYVNSAETNPFVASNVVVQGYAIVSGFLGVGNGLTVTGEGRFIDDVHIQGDAYVASGLTVTGNISTNQVNAVNVVSQFAQITSGNFTQIATGVTAAFATGIFQDLTTVTFTGVTVGIGSGTAVDFTVANNLTTDSGFFNFLKVDTIIATGITISGDVIVDNITVTGTLSGSTITGDLINVNELNVGTGSGNFTYLSGATVTGEFLDFTSGNFEQLVVSQDLTVTGDLNIDDITADVITANAGIFDYVSGTVVTGDTGNFDIIVCQALNAASLEFSGDRNISGNVQIEGNLQISGFTNVSGDLNIGSGLIVSGSFSGTVISGQSGIFDTIVTAPTFSGGSATFTGLVVNGNATITGDTNVGNDLTVSNNLTVSGGQILAPFGTVSAPGFAYAADPSMGIMNQAGNAMTHAINGVSGMTLTTGVALGNNVSILTIWAT